MSVGILNYGVGNVGSLVNMFRKLDIETALVSTADDMEDVSQLVVPGVGSFDYAMRALAQTKLIEPLNSYVSSGRSLLGICLGMQLLMESSEEGTVPGLGYIGGVSKRFEVSSSRLRVPHMGWNRVAPAQESGVFSGLQEHSRFYFVHSYHVECAEESNVLARTNYGGDFTSMVIQGNIVGAQFHPEKSHVYGMAMLESWASR